MTSTPSSSLTSSSSSSSSSGAAITGIGDPNYANIAAIRTAEGALNLSSGQSISDDCLGTTCNSASSTAFTTTASSVSMTSAPSVTSTSTGPGTIFGPTTFCQAFGPGEGAGSCQTISVGCYAPSPTDNVAIQTTCSGQSSLTTSAVSTPPITTTMTPTTTTADPTNPNSCTATPTAPGDLKCQTSNMAPRMQCGVCTAPSSCSVIQSTIYG